MKPLDKTKKAKGLVVNFEGVTVKKTVPEGEYHAKVVEITVEDGNEHKYLKWTFQVIDSDKTLNGAKLFTNTSLAPKALWNLRNLLETLGVEVPDSELSLDLESYIDLELNVRVEHEDYEGKPQARITDYSPIEESAASTDDSAEEETEEGEEAEEEAEEEEAEPEPVKPAKAAASKPSKKPAPEPVEETEEEAETVTADEVREMDDDEIVELVKKHKLKVDLKAIKNAGKRIAAVLDALEKADLLSE